MKRVIRIVVKCPWKKKLIKFDFCAYHCKYNCGYDDNFGRNIRCSYPIIRKYNL